MAAGNARQKTLTAAWEKEEVQKKWDASSWAKKHAKRAARAAATDFDRFKAKVAHQRLAAAVKAKL
jgi:large subunit ribosomal protein L14e